MGDSIKNADIRPFGYVFIYKRAARGVENNFVILPSDGWRGAAAAHKSIKYEDEILYAMPAVDEKLMISVTEEGIYYIEYTSPREVVDLLSYEAGLMPFALIKERFEKFILMNGYSKEHQISLNITEIKLGMMDVKVADNPNQFIQIPVWDFYGHYEVIYKNLNDSDIIQIKQPFQVLLTINAIDGSIIDRNLGY